jgi:hypothetical protein
VGNSSNISKIELGPSAPAPTVGGSSSVAQTVRHTGAQGPFVLAPVDVGNSATVNDNQRILNGLASPKVSPYDTSTGTTYVAATRTLTVGGSITLGGGTYNFCKLTIANNGRLQIAPGAIVRVFVDSPERAGSGCAAGTGSFSAANNSTIENPSGAPQNLQLYVYGFANGTNVVDFSNSGAVAAAIYAPQSQIVFKNAASVTGAIAGRRVEFKNTVAFSWSSALTELRARTLTLFYRTAWKQCTPRQTSPSDPYSGC